MDKKTKGYWILTSRKISQEIFDEYLNKVIPQLIDLGGLLFAKDMEPVVKERTQDYNLALFVNFFP